MWRLLVIITKWICWNVNSSNSVDTLHRCSVQKDKVKMKMHWNTYWAFGTAKPINYGSGGKGHDKGSLCGPSRLDAALPSCCFPLPFSPPAAPSTGGSRHSWPSLKFNGSNNTCQDFPFDLVSVWNRELVTEMKIRQSCTFEYIQIATR